MADEEAPGTDDAAQQVELPDIDLGPTELYVYVERGPEFDPSPRLEAALEELSAAIAEEEVAEVAGFTFAPRVAMGSALEPSGAANNFAIGCLRVGCVKITCETRQPCNRCNPRSCDTYSVTTSPGLF